MTELETGDRWPQNSEQNLLILLRLLEENQGATINLISQSQEGIRQNFIFL